jgi:hypothetical protein
MLDVRRHEPVPDDIFDAAKNPINIEVVDVASTKYA